MTVEKLLLTVKCSFCTAVGFQKGAISQDDLEHLKVNPEELMANMTRNEIEILISRIGKFEFILNLFFTWIFIKIMNFKLIRIFIWRWPRNTSIQSIRSKIEMLNLYIRWRWRMWRCLWFPIEWGHQKIVEFGFRSERSNCRTRYWKYSKTIIWKDWFDICDLETKKS